MVKLKDDIARAQKIVDVSSKQNHEQIVAARQALQIKIDTFEKSITEWEAKVSDANQKIATADSLKQEVVRNQGLFDRLSALLQNVDISRNIDQETLAPSGASLVGDPFICGGQSLAVAIHHHRTGTWLWDYFPFGRA